jgi:hypothetical protein
MQGAGKLASEPYKSTVNEPVGTRNAADEFFNMSQKERPRGGGVFLRKRYLRFAVLRRLVVFFATFFFAAFLAFFFAAMVQKLECLVIDPLPQKLIPKNFFVRSVLLAIIARKK